MSVADIASVEKIEQQSHSPWSVVALFEELKQNRGVLLVAELNDVDVTPHPIIGWCACRYLAPEAELLKIAVHKDTRKQGVATTIIDNLAFILIEKSVETLFLEVRSQNQSALNFYTKNGFLQTGTRADYYRNPVDTALLLQKKL